LFTYIFITLDLKKEKIFVFMAIVDIQYTSFQEEYMQGI